MPKTTIDNLRPIVGLREIAQEADVSVATVSRALRDDKMVASDTRDRVLATAERLRYRPNLLMRGVRSGRTRTIGLLLPAHNQFYGHMLAGIHDLLVRERYVPIVVWSNLDNRSGRGPDELDQIHQLVDRRVDGVILRPVEDAASDEYLHEIWDRRLPAIAIDRQLPHTHADFVGTDDEEGARQAAEHLLGLGHRRLAHLAGPSSTSTGRLRRLSFERAVRQVPGAVCTTATGTFSYDREVMAAAMNLLRREPRPTAIFTASDDMAMSVYEAAEKLQIRIPEDLSVVGYANKEFAQFTRPRLTTVEQFPKRVGRAAARLLLQRIQQESVSGKPELVRIPPKLVVRDSTCPPRGEAM